MNLSVQELRIVSLFIEPIIVSAIISGLFSWGLSRKSARLSNITAERSKWRDKIRVISEDIQDGNIDKLKTALRRLRLCINAYGLEDDVNGKRFNAYYIMKDTHIWVLIYQIEKLIEEGKSVSLACEQMTKYLCLLLKYDWERAKNEVGSSLTIIFGRMIMITGMISVFVLPIVGYIVRELSRCATARRG